jgi:hypothetical protein
MAGSAAKAEPITITFLADLNIVDMGSPLGSSTYADPDELLAR